MDAVLDQMLLKYGDGEYFMRQIAAGAFALMRPRLAERSARAREGFFSAKETGK